MNRTLRVLNLGAGVESTWLYLMAVLGLIEPFDYAITGGGLSAECEGGCGL